MKHYQTQIDLFTLNGTDAYSRRTDPDTSAQAAESIRPTQLEAQVLSALTLCGSTGATAHDLVAMTSLPWQTVSPRLAPLCRKGYATQTNLRRPGPSGRNCIVFRAT